MSLLDGKLNLAAQKEVLDHIGRCDICHEAVYSIIRDRDPGICGREPYPAETRLIAAGAPAFECGHGDCPRRRQQRPDRIVTARGWELILNLSCENRVSMR